MKYAKSDKGYYIPKGSEQQMNPGMSGDNTAMQGAPDPVRGETSLSFEDAGYVKTKDKYGNEMFVADPSKKSGFIDYQAKEGDQFHMKTVAFVKNSNGTFKPVVYDVKSRNVDDFLTKQIGVDLAGGMQLSGGSGSDLNSEAVGKLLYKNAAGNYTSGPIGEIIQEAQKNPGKTQYIPTHRPGQSWKVNTNNQ